MSTVENMLRPGSSAITQVMMNHAVAALGCLPYLHAPHCYGLARLQAMLGAYATCVLPRDFGWHTCSC